MSSVMNSPQYTTKLFHKHTHKLVIWKLGLFFLVEIMIRFTVWSTKASLTPNVAVIVMRSLCLFCVTFIQILKLFKTLECSGPEPL